MQLVDITPERFDEASALLARGFPRRSAADWRAGIARIHEIGENGQLGIPVGRLMMGGGAPVGVILTPAGRHMAADGTERIHVNLSSWYVEPNHRWRARAMLKAVLTPQEATFTDLTPTVTVQAMIATLDFHKIAEGADLHLLPALALRRGRLTVRALEGASGLGPSFDEMLAAHRRLGCTAAMIEGEGGIRHALLLKPITLRRLPSMQLIYGPALDTLDEALPSLARFLLARGRLILLNDAHGPKPWTAVRFRDRGRKFALGAFDPSGIDYTWSEFVYFDVPG